jgi:hypothetical protein
MADRVQINALERALSQDVNDLQSMSARLLNDFLANLGALRAIMNSGGIFDTVPQSVVMGLDVRGAGANLVVGAGILSQFSLTWPAAPGALESSQRLGVLRANATVPVPATIGTFMILEARVVDVITVSTTRDVFDVPTQTFIPTLVTKQVERQIEFQIVQGTTTALPVFTGDPWVPILGFATDGAGLVPSLPGVFQLDLRNNLKDMLGDIQVRSVGDADQPETVVESWAIHGDDGGPLVGGNFMARLGAGRVWLKADPGLLPADDATVLGTANTAEHLYLCPLIANGITIYPVITNNVANGSVKGIPLRSALPAADEGPDNVSVLNYGTLLFAPFDPVPFKKAVYMGQVYIDRTGYPDYVPFTQSSGGRVLLRSDRTAPTNPLVRVVNRLFGPIVGSESIPFDLNAKIPNCARTAILHIQVTATGAPGEQLRWVLFRQGSGRRYGLEMVLNAEGPGVKANGHMLEIPVHETDQAGTAKLWGIDLFSPTTLPSTGVSAVIDVLGWTY